MTTDTFTEFKKLAEAADDSAVHVINAMAEKYPLGADFERYNDDIRKMVEFCTDELAPELVRLVEECEKVLQDNLGALEQVPDDGFGFAEDGSGDEYGPNRWSIACELESATKMALASINRVRRGEHE